jgi:hypothetical protein
MYIFDDNKIHIVLLKKLKYFFLLSSKSIFQYNTQPTTTKPIKRNNGDR